MNIYTELVQNKRYDYAIKPCLLKRSQEYRVLATLRYLLPQEYSKMEIGESPDLQDCESSVGIEVTAAVCKDDMKVASAFSKLHQASSIAEMEKYEKIIESSGYSFVSIQGEKSAISTTGTSNGERIIFQESIRKKKTKLQQYRDKFKVLGLAIILPEIPTSEAEACFVDWAREVFKEDDKLFDFIYVLSNRFCIYYGVRADCSRKWIISSKENNLLCTIARMTAKGELSLEAQEWQ